MALNIARWLSITCTQGGADAFVQGSVATDIVPEDGFILKLTRCEIEFLSNLSVLAADLWMEWSVTRDTKTAVAKLADPDVIISDCFNYALVTSGVATFSNFFSYDLSGIYLVEPTIYAQLDSQGGAGAFSYDMRLYYEQVRASEIEILRITTQS